MRRFLPSWSVLPYHSLAIFRATESGSRSRPSVHNAHLAFSFHRDTLVLGTAASVITSMFIAWFVHIRVLERVEDLLCWELMEWRCWG